MVSNKGEAQIFVCGPYQKAALRNRKNEEQERTKWDEGDQIWVCLELEGSPSLWRPAGQGIFLKLNSEESLP